MNYDMDFPIGKEARNRKKVGCMCFLNLTLPNSMGDPIEREVPTTPT